jgi:hypothetical protein
MEFVTEVFFLMILFHIIDDFVLQPVCLSKLKQQSFWTTNAPSKMYKNDYKMALFIHSLSWSIMIHVPIMLWMEYNIILLIITISLNTVIHYIVDDLKANKYKINLITDQSIHLLQILITHILTVLLS